MKIIFKYLTYIFCLFTFLSCEDEVTIIDSYPFQISVTGTKEAFLTETLENEFIITSKNLAKNTSFSFIYDASGKGYYKIEDSKIKENEFYSLPEDVLSTSLEFVPLEEGELQVDFFVTNNKEHSNSYTSSYTIKKELTEFEFNLTPEKQEILIGELSSISLSIQQTTDEVLTYSVLITSNSDAEINWGGRQNLPFIIENIQKGNYTLEYIPTEVIDKSNFTITIKASNGIEKIQVFEGAEVLPVEFDFSLSNSVISVSENQFNDIITITLNRPNFQTYALIYQPQYYLIISTSTKGIYLDNGKNSFGTNIPLAEFTGVVNESFNHYINFVGEVIGGEITFTVFNDTGFEVSKSITIEVLND